MIERLPISEIMPAWQTPKADRYVSHPSLRTAMIQVLAEPASIYVVTDQKLPVSVAEARAMVSKWNETNEATPP